MGLTIFSWAQRPGDNPGDLPDNVDTSDCTSKPPAKNFDIKLKWKTKDMRSQGNSVHGCSTPMVADMDGDGNPEVIGVWCPPTLTDGYNVPGGYVTYDLLVLDGKTGDLKYKIKTKNFQTMGQTIAIGDVDGDGKSEIFIESISSNQGG